TQIGQMAGAMSGMDPQQQQMIMAAMGYGYLLPYARQHETQADEVGLLLAAAACFDPREAVPLWERMSQASGGQAAPEFASTHPNPGPRIQNLGALMPKALEYRRRFCDGAGGAAPCARRRSVVHEQAAVDRQVGTGDVVGLVGGEEGDRAGDVARLPEPADRDLRHDPLARGIGHGARHGGFDETGRDAVDGDALAGGLARQGHGEAVQAGLGRGVVGLAEVAGLAADRADVDDASEAARDHALDRVAAQVE